MSLANYPTIRPSLILDFQKAEVVDPRITFTRASSATRYNSYGLLETVGNDVPRIDFNPTTLVCNGLLVEESRTNLLTYSEDFTNAAWTKVTSTITANSAVAPDGTLTADTITADAGTFTTAPRASQNNADISTRTLSLYAKAGTYNFIKINPRSFAGVGGIVVDLSSGTVTSTSNVTPPTNVSVTSVGNGWYRIAFTTTSTGATATFRIALATSATTDNDGGTFAGTETVFIWGAQLEVGAFATSYIKTVAATVTRQADIATMTGTNFSSWYNAAAGTLAAGWVTYATEPTNNRGIVAIDDGSNNNRVAQFIPPSGSPMSVAARVVTGGTETNPANAGSITVSSSVRSALAYGTGTNQAGFSVNGSAVTTASPAAPPVSPTTLRIGTIFGSNNLGGWVQRVTYYPTRLTDVQLQALTAT